MIPHDKAKELVDKFNGYVRENEGFSYAKQCALIAVQLILDNNCNYWAYDSVTDDEIMIDSEYWKQVKEEVEKL